MNAFIARYLSSVDLFVSMSHQSQLSFVAEVSRSSEKSAGIFPFLELPLELRDYIYSLILPPRTIHITSETFRRTLNQEEQDRSLMDVNRAVEDGPKVFEDVYTENFSFDVCQEYFSEHEAYSLAQQTSRDDPFGLRPTCWVNGRRPDKEGVPTHCRYCTRHALCTHYWQRHIAHNTKRNEFALFRACRQTRREAKIVLWTTTLFSFTHAYALSCFIKSLTPLRRQYVKAIRLGITKGYKAEGWTSGVDDLVSTLGMLRWLRTLHVDIRQYALGAYNLDKDDPSLEYKLPSYSDYVRMLDDGSFPWWREDLVLFRGPRLRDVTVVVEEDATAPLYSASWGPEDEQARMRQQGDWTMAEKAEFARLLGDKLLAP